MPAAAACSTHRSASTITRSYTAAQQELVQRILRSIASSDEGYTKLTRNGTFDGGGSLGNCGAYIFGNPSNNRQYAWVFAGHHITVRCDGNSEAERGLRRPHVLRPQPRRLQQP